MDTSDFSQRVLLVEEGATVLPVTQQGLRDAGFDVVRVGDTVAAAAAAASGLYAAVLIDPDLPGDPDGIELARDILNTTLTPVIIVSRRGDLESVDRVGDLPHSGYVVTSNDSALVATVRGASARGKLRRSYPATAFDTAFSRARQMVAVTEMNCDRFVAVNDSFVRATGNTREELVGHGPVDIGLLDEDTRGLLGEFVRSPSPGRSVDVPLTRKDDARIWVRYSVAPIVYDSHYRLLSISEDVTDRIYADRLRDVRVRLAESASDLSIAQLLQDLLDEAEALTDSEFGFFHFMEPDERTVAMQIWSTRARAGCKATSVGRHEPIDAAGVWIDCIRERGPVIHNDYPSLPHRHGLPGGHVPITREILIPLIRSGAIVGVLGVGNRTARYTELDISILTELADAAWDIVLRRRTEISLHESRANLSALVENTDGIIWSVDDRCRLIVGNAAFGDYMYEMCGVRPNPGDVVVDAMQSPLRDRWESYFEQALSGERFDVTVEETAGTYREFRFGQIRDEPGTITGITVYGRDITGQMRVERALRETLRDRDALMAELNHRAKNNLLMVTSLIDLRQHSSADTIDLSDLRNQVDAIRTVHDRLSQTDGTLEIDFREYASDLLQSVFASVADPSIEWGVDGPNVRFPARLIVPLGLIISETATNAVKHAFPYASEKHYSVRLSADRGWYELRILNSGPPIPDNVSLADPRTLGMQIIAALVRQLNANLTIERDPRTEITLRFPTVTDP